jgi:hypothetical protein
MTFSARKNLKCAFSGTDARYLDPRTGIPYSRAKHFNIINQLMDQEYVWSASSGCYTSAQDHTGASGVPHNWSKSVTHGGNGKVLIARAVPTPTVLPAPQHQDQGYLRLISSEDHDVPLR